MRFNCITQFVDSYRCSWWIVIVRMAFCQQNQNRWRIAQLRAKKLKILWICFFSMNIIEININAAAVNNLECNYVERNWVQVKFGSRHKYWMYQTIRMASAILWWKISNERVVYLYINFNSIISVQSNAEYLLNHIYYNL